MKGGVSLAREWEGRKDEPILEHYTLVAGETTQAGDEQVSSRMPHLRAS